MAESSSTAASSNDAMAILAAATERASPNAANSSEVEPRTAAAAAEDNQAPAAAPAAAAAAVAAEGEQAEVAAPEQPVTKSEQKRRLKAQRIADQRIAKKEKKAAMKTAKEQELRAAGKPVPWLDPREPPVRPPGYKPKTQVPAVCYFQRCSYVTLCSHVFIAMRAFAVVILSTGLLSVLLPLYEQIDAEALQQRALASGYRVVLDMSFRELMTDKERLSMRSQVCTVISQHRQRDCMSSLAFNR
jgi:hypothetical protein